MDQYLSDAAREAVLTRARDLAIKQCRSSEQSGGHYEEVSYCESQNEDYFTTIEYMKLASELGFKKYYARHTNELISALNHIGYLGRDMFDREYLVTLGKGAALTGYLQTYKDVLAELNTSPVVEHIVPAVKSGNMILVQYIIGRACEWCISIDTVREILSAAFEKPDNAAMIDLLIKEADKYDCSGNVYAVLPDLEETAIETDPEYEKYF